MDDRKPAAETMPAFCKNDLRLNDMNKVCINVPISEEQQCRGKQSARKIHGDEEQKKKQVTVML
jgi:hypothetical protein